uniref:Uncharacterized protein n=1 Tax=Lactuca sativa TaxID=4236 RepID=A0A9R1UX37_LACSA|nr:hypothetical protein LSAT_V11C700345810 [Lactuca sativa]
MSRIENRPVCGDMFRHSCFGDYVNILMGVEYHHLLCHYLTCKEFTTFDPVDLQELLFPGGDYRVCFDRKTFFLVTDLQFGDYYYPSSGFAEFKKRVFPFVSLSRSMSIAELMHMFNNLLHQLSNEDVSNEFGGNTLDNQLLMSIWIIDTFPNSSTVGSPISSIIPQALAYPRMRRL